MRIQDRLIDETREAMAEAFRYAKATPEEKIEWRPMDAGQTVLSIARELAKCPDWAIEIAMGKGLDMSEEGQAATAKEYAEWNTIAQCEAAGEEKLGNFFEVVKGLSDDRLGETMDLPFGPEGSMKTFTMAEMMDYPRWNATYHLGQIAYIQTLYGDKAMH